MKRPLFKRLTRFAGLAILLAGLSSPAVLAHCDTLDGPVVRDAKVALDTKQVTPVLKWLRPENEREVKEAFSRALSVRSLSPEARDLADRFFFETVVRLHRAGEGAPFTGLKPAGEVEEVVRQADAALASGDLSPLEDHLLKAISKRLRQNFMEARQAHAHAQESVAAGREFVGAYILFVHYAEELEKVGSGLSEADLHADHALASEGSDTAKPGLGGKEAPPHSHKEGR